MQGATTKEWVFTTAKTDFQIEAVGATQQMAVLFVCATCANSNTADVSVRLGMATATLPTVTADSATGNTSVFFTHGGIAKGGGAVESNGGAPIAIGALDEDLRITCSAATGGSMRLVVTWRMMETA